MARSTVGLLAIGAGILAFVSVASKSSDLIAPQRGDSLFPRYTIIADSVLSYGANGSVVVRRCGVGKVFLRIASHGKWIAGDTITVNACNLLPCDSVNVLFRVRGDTSVMPLPCRKLP